MPHNWIQMTWVWASPLELLLARRWASQVSCPHHLSWLCLWLWLEKASEWVGPTWDMPHQHNMGWFLRCMFGHCDTHLPPWCMEGCWSLAPWAHCFKENLRETDAWFEWNAQKKSMCCQNSPVKRPCYIIPSYMCRAKCCHLQRARWYSNVTTNVTQHWVKQRARRCHQEIHNANDSGTNVQAIILTLFNTSNCSLF